MITDSWVWVSLKVPWNSGRITEDQVGKRMLDAKNFITWYSVFHDGAKITSTYYHDKYCKLEVCSISWRVDR